MDFVGANFNMQRKKINECGKVKNFPRWKFVGIHFRWRNENAGKFIIRTKDPFTVREIDWTMTNFGPAVSRGLCFVRAISTIGILKANKFCHKACTSHVWGKRIARVRVAAARVQTRTKIPLCYKREKGISYEEVSHTRRALHPTDSFFREQKRGVFSCTSKGHCQTGDRT